MERVTVLARLLIFLALAYCWITNSPYRQISAFIGSHFPWSATTKWKWMGLLVEGALVQIVMTLPAALILGILLKRWAIGGALSLCAIFAIQTIVTVNYESARDSHSGVLFAVYLGICHALLLFGFTLLFRSRSNKRFERSRAGASVGQGVSR
jgi:hypothetical protein